MSEQRFLYIGLVILAVFFSLIGVGSAQPITAPTVITSPGMYELTADARSLPDVYGIKIESSDVVLDGQSHFLGGDQREDSIGVYVNKYGDSITNVTVKNLKMEKWDTAVSYQYVKGEEGDQNLVDNLDIIDCTTGIHIEYSDVIEILDTLIRECSTAINVEENSNKVALSKNTLKDNGAGVVISKTSDVSLKDNNINTCDVYGVQITDSTGLSLVKNSISDNKYAAVQIESSTDSTITDNNFSKTETGPVLVIGNGVQNTDIYNNYFGSMENVSVDDIGSGITWNTSLETGVNILGGPYKGGNYWGSAPGFEGFSDTTVDEDGFGIGDKAFEINSNNIDYLPLTHTDKNYPAPTPEPVVPESVNETTESENQTADNTTVALFGSESNSSNETLSPMDSTPDIAVTEENTTIPPAVVQNEYVASNSTLALSPMVQGTGAADNYTAPGTNMTSVPVAAPVKNGYLLFTGLTPGNQVVLITTAGSEVDLDKVPTTSLSVPVPADIALYSSWKILENNQTLANGTIPRYPVADETVVINILEPVLPTPPLNTFNSSDIPQEVSEPVVSPLSSPVSDTLPAVNESFIPQSFTPQTDTVPQVLTMLPSSSGNESTASSEPIVMMNSADDTYTPGHTITAYAGPGGAIFPEGSVEVMSGEDVTFVLTPYTGHDIEYLLVDGGLVSSTDEYHFVNVTQDHTIIAGFT